MATLLYATTNPGKVVSLQRRLSPAGIEVIQRGLSIPEPRLDRVEDTAIFKVLFAYQELREPVVALDAGFYIFGLNGFPRTYVNFALETVKLEGLMALAKMTDRRCEFRHAIAYRDGDGGPVVFMDRVSGTLTTEPRGVYQPARHWSPLVTVFVPNGKSVTLAEMSEAEHADWRDRELTEPSYAELFLAWYRRHRLPTISQGI